MRFTGLTEPQLGQKWLKNTQEDLLLLLDFFHMIIHRVFYFN